MRASHAIGTALLMAWAIPAASHADATTGTSAVSPSRRPVAIVRGFSIATPGAGMGAFTIGIGVACANSPGTMAGLQSADPEPL